MDFYDKLRAYLEFILQDKDTDWTKAIKTLVQDYLQGIIPNVSLEKFCRYMNTTDFLTAPASTKFHDTEEKGLVKHSVRVAYWALQLLPKFIPKYKDEDICWLIIAALAHDFCKVDRFVPVEKWKKVDGSWVSYKAWEVRSGYTSTGHGAESMRRLIFLIPQVPYLVQQAVYWHMGLFDSQDYKGFFDSYKNFPFVLLIMNADMLSTSKYLTI